MILSRDNPNGLVILCFGKIQQNGTVYVPIILFQKEWIFSCQLPILSLSLQKEGRKLSNMGNNIPKGSKET